jgi:hypothetical protein
MNRLSMLAPVAVALAASSAACVVVDDSSLSLYNDSSYVLTEVYLAELDDPTWGPNLLPQPLFPGDELIVESIDCGTYDVLVVDETGLECQLSGLDLCGNDEGWIIDDVVLDTCAFQ